MRQRSAFSLALGLCLLLVLFGVIVGASPASAGEFDAPTGARVPQGAGLPFAVSPGGLLSEPALAKEIADFELEVPIVERGAAASPAEQLFASRCRSVVLVLRITGSGKDQEVGSGTGSIVSREGYILTSAHVVSGVDRVGVGIFPNCDPGTKPEAFVAAVVRINPVSDLALLKLEQVPKDLDVMPLGNLDEVRTGSTVMMIGHPRTLLMSMSQGLVSAIRPNYQFGIEKGKERLATVIQTDGAINPGNSGGPMISMEGHLVGVNAFILGQASAGLNFAVSVADVRTFLSGEQSPETQRARPAPATQAQQDCKPRKVKEWQEDGATKFLLDFKCTGKADGLLIVPDDPGQRTVLLVDRNGDGKADVKYYLNRKGLPEYSEWDDNFDGSYSYRAEHENGEWEPKSKVRVAGR